MFSKVLGFELATAREIVAESIPLVGSQSITCRGQRLSLATNGFGVFRTARSLPKVSSAYSSVASRQQDGYPDIR